MNGIGSGSKKKENSSKGLAKIKAFDHTFKIVIIGDTCVGKSCILIRYADDQFIDQFYATIGWDTAGQERFKTITSAYYRGADGIIVVYDITDRDWLEEVNRITSDDPIKFIVGNKSDVDHKKEVFDSDVQALEQQTGIPVFTVSAKANINVIEIFEEMTKKLIDRAEKKKYGLDSSINKSHKINESNSTKNNSNCC